jgi:hypothetical protein
MRRAALWITSLGLGLVLAQRESVVHSPDGSLAPLTFGQMTCLRVVQGERALSGTTCVDLGNGGGSGVLRLPLSEGTLEVPYRVDSALGEVSYLIRLGAAWRWAPPAAPAGDPPVKEAAGTTPPPAAAPSVASPPQGDPPAREATTATPPAADPPVKEAASTIPSPQGDPPAKEREQPLRATDGRPPRKNRPPQSTRDRPLHRCGRTSHCAKLQMGGSWSTVCWPVPPWKPRPAVSSCFWTANPWRVSSPGAQPQAPLAAWRPARASMVGSIWGLLRGATFG